MAKLYVTENIGNEHKFYLTKIKMESTDSIRQSENSGINSSPDSTISVSEIFDFVKKNNDLFESDSHKLTAFTPICGKGKARNEIQALQAKR